MVTVTVANVSHKDITASNLSVKETLADGSINSSELLADYVGRIALVKEAQGTPDEASIRKQFGDGLFHPGETLEEMVGVQPGAKDIQVVVDSVTYADHTNESTNVDGLQRIISHRKLGLRRSQLCPSGSPLTFWTKRTYLLPSFVRSLTFPSRLSPGRKRGLV